MKNFLQPAVLMAALLVGATLTACDDNTGTNTDPKIEDPKTVSITAPTGGSVTVEAGDLTAGNITFTATAEWALTIKEGNNAITWLRVKQNGDAISEGDAGTFTLATELDANTTENQRTARIQITCGTKNATLDIIQLGEPAPTANDITIEGTIDGYADIMADYPGYNKLVIYTASYESNYPPVEDQRVLASTTVAADGSFSLILRASAVETDWTFDVADKLAADFTTDTSGLTVTDPENAKTCNAYIKLVDEDEPEDYWPLFYYGEDDATETWLYSDLVYASAPYSVSGTGENYSTLYDVTTSYVFGWNWSYSGQINGDAVATTTKPSGCTFGFILD